MESYRSSPSRLFDVAHSARTGPFDAVHIPTRDGEGAGVLCGRRDSFTAFLVDTGFDILCYMDFILERLTPVVAPNLLEQLLRSRSSKTSEWTIHRKELWRMMEEFLLPAADLPTVFWTHSLCWT